ncbi:MAG: DUF6702 family protein [Pirellulaceae bacterium]
MFKISIAIAPLALVAVCVLSSTVAAHPFHISTAEMEYNADSKRFEVSLKVHVTDIEQALAAQAKRSVDIEKDQQADKLLTSYIEQHFFVTSRSHARGLDANAQKKPSDEIPKSKVRWVGKELESTWLWLYFELEVPTELEKPTLVNSVLIDTTDGQINTTTYRHGRKRSSFKTSRKQPWAEL